MRQLRGEDARFVYAESGHANSNITLISIYDPSTAATGRVHFKGMLRHIESRLHLSPIFRQKLLRVPLELDFPYWIEDESFDLEYHVRHIALPKPGDWRQFCIQASRIHSRPLDLSRPLWEIYLVEGLDSLLNLPKDSFGILAKIHHAAIDAHGGAEISTLLHDTTPTPASPEPPEPWFPESPPGGVSLLARALVNNVVRPVLFAGPLTRALGKLTPAVLGFDRRPLAESDSHAGHPLQCRSVAAPGVRHATLFHRRIQAHPRTRAGRDRERRDARRVWRRVAALPAATRGIAGREHDFRGAAFRSGQRCAA